MQCRENNSRSYVCLKEKEEKEYYGWASEYQEDHSKDDSDIKDWHEVLPFALHGY